MKIFTLRFMWKLVGSDNINFKIVTDTEDGLEEFKKLLLNSVDDLESASYEYLFEYDCPRLGVFVPIKTKDGE